MSTDAQHALPNTYDFGLNFNYAVWGAGSQVDLVNVPWNNDYRDIVRFANRAALDTYIDSLAPAGISIDKISYAKPNQPVRINVPFNKVYKYNYIRVSAPVQPVTPADENRKYYYFITDVRYLAPNATEIVVQLDVWQTFGYDVQFGNCYVERGHIGIANTKQMDFYGNDYLTVPEGLDTGGEYNNVHRENREIAHASKMNVIAISTVDLLADPGTVDDPKLKSAPGSISGNIPSGASYYIWQNSTTFRNWLISMQDKPWVTQGIIMIYVTPPLSDFGITVSWGAGNNPAIMSSAANSKTTSLLTDWRNNTSIMNNISTRYRHLRKFWTYPYMAIELTTWSATPIIVKPESWMNDNATVTEYLSAVMPGAKYLAFPANYNSSDASRGEQFNMATQVSNFPQGVAVNSGAISYLASNRNSIAFQHQSADWSQQRALTAAQTSYDQASSAMNLATELTGIGNQVDTWQTQNTTDAMIMNAGINAIGGVLGSAGTGAVAGPAGLAVGVGKGALDAALTAGSTAVNVGAQHNANANRVAGANMANRANVGNMGYIRDTNKNLAEFAAKGDYANAIAGINAKVQDAKMIQPTVSGQLSGETFNFATFNMDLVATWKMVMPNAQRMIGEFWLQYGYAINRFIKPPASMMVMEKFTYWKMKQTYLTGAPMPETFKQTIRGIFEKGVIVWANPADIGNIDIADNAPLPGVSY